MKRKAIRLFQEWKDRKGRKPLIVYGARQVGKTWLMKEFAKTCFQDHIYINFEDEDRLSHIFENDFDIQRILDTIALAKNHTITTNTLLIFDELQTAKRGITALKYFYEKAPQQPVIAAGSLLGIAQHANDSFPVGKVDSLRLYPMDFEEFLLATGREKMADTLHKRQWEIIASAADIFQTALREYYYVGGMPEVVESFRQTHDYNEVRRLQNNIIDNYERDFSKHAPNAEVPRIRMVWQSVASQLAKENRKFIYGQLKKGARAKDFEIALEWLIDAGLVRKINRANNAELPLSAFEDFSAFKLFLLDVGLLCAINKLTADTLINGNAIFLTAKGSLTEQYVAQQLSAADNVHIAYWSAENSIGEIDFLIQSNDKVIPIEVKAEENLKSKSLKAFVERYPTLRGLRLSMSNYREQEWMTNAPLYALPFLAPDFLEKEN